MNIYKYIDVDKQEYISNKIYEYISKNTLILHKRYMWNDISVSLLLNHVPELAIELKKIINHDITMISVIYMDAGRIGGTHIDTGPYDYRVLWPIKNCQGSYTKFYDLNGNNINVGYGKNGDKYLGVEEVNPLIEIESIELIKPVVFNTNLPHAVHTNPECDGPRITVTIGFGDYPLVDLFH